MRNTRSEYFTSDMPSTTDIARTCGHFREVARGARGESDVLRNVCVVPCMDGARGARVESDVLRSVRVQPCIRPLNAAVMAAGLDVIRRSVPTKSTRSFLAWHIAGFPIDGLEPFRINVIVTLAVRERTDATSSSRCQALLAFYAAASRGAR